ncbi:MAG: sulfatase, partial [Lysobacterales bacterium]
MLNIHVRLILVTLLLSLSAQSVPAIASPQSERPNILIAISDDHSWLHTSVQGSAFVETPNLDSVANGGFRFSNAYAASPGCSPSRAALLTGQHHWMLGPAGTHGSSFPVHYQTFVDLLERAGYKAGFTGKGWGPGDWLAGGRKKNPAGVEYNEVKLKSKPQKGISDTDYAGNFQQFMDERSDGEPFVFWYGAHEPHLPYAEVTQNDEDLGKVEVPGFLPDTVDSRSMLLDYADEINHFDTHLGKIIASLDAAGELENTLIIVTADNGMPMPRAKSNGYDFGIHVPLSIRWGKSSRKGRIINEPVGFVDLSATIIEAAGLEIPDQFVGQSLLGLLNGDIDELDYDRAVYSGRER